MSRAGKVDRGSMGTRLAHARALLSPADRTRLEMLVLTSPASLLAAGEIRRAADLSLAETVEMERERLFAKAAAAANAVQRRDPIGRAWHEGLLDGQGVDPEVLRDTGRHFGFLYWHEYRAVDATVGGYTEMVALGSVRLEACGRDALGGLWKVYSRIVDDMGREARGALDRLCVDDMWFAEGPDWLDRMINTARVLHEPKAVAGELARKEDCETMRLALGALVALARGGAVKAPVMRLDDPQGAFVEDVMLVTSPPAIDPRFYNSRGYMRPWNDVRDIILGKTTAERLDAEEAA